MLGRRNRGRAAGVFVGSTCSEDGSQYGLSAGILPPLGAGSGRRVPLKPYIISPYNPTYRSWDTILVVLVIYTAWVSPFEFGFLQKPIRSLTILDNCVNALFAIDIVLTFFVAYLDKSIYLLVDDLKQIAWRYTTSWLALDVISTIPSELALKIFPSPLNSYGLLRMLRLWRLRRVSALFSRLEKDINFNYFWVRCAKLFCVTLLVVHCAGCFYFLVAARSHNPKDTWIGSSNPNFHEQSLWIQYLTTMTTVGNGDLHPVNNREMIFDIFYMLLKFGLAAYLIGNMTNLVAHGANRTKKFRDTIQAASSFALRNRLPPRLLDQMLAHLCFKYRTISEGLQQQEILESLPKAIQLSISHYLFYSLVDKVYLFQGVSNDLLFQLAAEMTAGYFAPNEDVILQNELPTNFYMLVNGAADIILSKGGVEQVIGEAKTGDVCGEIGVLCYRPQLFTVRAKCVSQLLCLNRTTFLNIVQANVGDGTIIMNNLLQHLKNNKDPFMESILLETECMLAQGKMDLPLSLCFAALRGDDSLLNQLLRRGLDPNEADNNGRTSLHIAASQGSENCVLLLLDHGADPNRRDMDGSVPLWEAILGGHEHIVKLLLENGATLSSGDVGKYSCIAAGQNDLNLLKEIVHYGGDVTYPNTNGSTALHVAVSEDNIEIVKFLLDQGADFDKPDIHSWTPRELADQQGHEEISLLFQSYKEAKPQSVLNIIGRERQEGTRRLGRFTSEPTNHQLLREGLIDGSGSQSRPRRQSNFHNTLFGVICAAQNGEKDKLFSIDQNKSTNNIGINAPRVTISCPEIGGISGKLVLLPQSLQELYDLGVKKFGIMPTKILTSFGAEIDDIRVIRDGDHLVFVSENASEKRS